MSNARPKSCKEVTGILKERGYRWNNRVRWKGSGFETVGIDARPEVFMNETRRLSEGSTRQNDEGKWGG